MRPADEAFLYSSFLKSFRESDHTEGLSNTLFFDVFKQEWSAVLQRFDVIVAHPEGDEDEIAGYLAHRDRTIAWVYVKKTPWRGMGVARTLLASARLLPDRERPGTFAIFALFGSSWALRLARDKGYVVRMTPHVAAVKLLLGVA